MSTPSIRYTEFYILTTLCVSLLYLEMYLIGPHYKFIFLLTYVSFVGLLTIYFVSRRVEYAILFLTITLVTQPLFTSLIIQRLDATTVKFIVSTKEVIILVTFGYLMSKCKFNRFIKKLNYLDYFFVIFLGVYGISLIHGGAPLFAKLISLREGAFLVFTYLIGRFSNLSLEGASKLLGQIGNVSLVVCIYGFLEYFLFPLSFWNSLGALDYTILKRGDSVLYGISGLVPNQWFSFYFGDYYRRMVSSILDPTSLSRYLVLPLMYYTFVKARIGSNINFLSIFSAVIILAAILLSLGKGGLLVALIAGSITLFYVNKVTSIISVIILVVLMLFTNVLDANEGNLDRHTSHYGVLVKEVINSPLGSGLGMTGQQAVNHGLVDEREGEESYFVSMVRQCGISGLISYILLFVVAPFSLIFSFYKRHRKVGIGQLAYLELVVYGCFLGVSVTSFLANSAVALISSGLVFIYLGVINKEKCGG